MTYEERCVALGITRPDTLAKGFGEDQPSVAIGKHPPMRRTVGERPVPALEDLTHLNPAHGARCQELTAQWWKSLSAEQKAALAARRGRNFAGRNYQKTFRGQ
jgi:hypothetical protein